MKIKFCYRLSMLLTVLLFIYGKLSAQQNDQLNGFVPEVGQKGKDVVWVPSPPDLISVMLSMAKVTPDDYVIDLGSGDGRVVISAAKLGAHGFGIEYNHDLVELSVRNAEKEGVSGKTEFIEGDLFKCDLSKATVITLFLLPDINKKLRPKLLDLKPGTRVVSNTFAMGDWVPDKEIITEENPNGWNTAYLWIVPAKAEGIWKIGNDILTIKQSYQVIHGWLTSQGRTYPISDGKLYGSGITFTIVKYLYTGLVNGEKMSGTRASDKVAGDWNAE
ncbi:MAG: methyltransferase domain-containing protein, partial [Bacteroidales bacterium]